MNRVLQLVGQRTVIAGAAHGIRAGIDVNDFPLITEREHGVWILVAGSVIAAGGLESGVEDI